MTGSHLLPEFHVLLPIAQRRQGKTADWLALTSRGWLAESTTIQPGAARLSLISWGLVLKRNMGTPPSRVQARLRYAEYISLSA